LPSLVLSYIGLQSIRQEQHRQEEIYLRNLEQSLSIAMTRVESHVEDRLQAVMNHLPVYELMNGSAFYPQVRHAIHQSPVVSDVFLLDQDFRVFYPRKYRPDQVVSQQLSYQERPLYLQATAFEARGMLEDAIAEYRKGLQGSESVVEAMALRNGIARCQLKMQNLPDARRNYREIIDLDQGRFLGGEVPFVLLAYHQLADIEAALGSPGAALNTMLDFYGLLADNFHHLRSAQHSYYISGIQEKIEGRLSGASEAQASRYLDIHKREKAAETERSFRLLFDNYILPVCRSNFQLSHHGPDLRYLRLQIANDQLVIAMKASPKESDGTRIMGLLLDEDEIKRIVSDAIESINARDEASLLLIPPGEYGEEYGREHGGTSTGYAGQAHLLSSGFSDIRSLLPGYGMGIHLDSDFDDIFRQTARLYYILFAGIVGIILFGIVFIFRDIYREQQFSRLKSAFIANVSHEIKTPVASIRVLADNLAEGLITSQERQKAYFRLISCEAEKLSYLTGNILDFSSMEAQRKVYQKEMINLYDLLQKVLQRFNLMHQKKDLVVHDAIPSDLTDIMASPEGIEQAVLNLLNNAAKHTGPDKAIWISLSQNNEEAVISVSDKGIGIAPEEQKKIFEKFYRVDNNGHNMPGSGIGLSLVREIAQMHNGSIEVKSAPGKGSTFSLKIPVNHAKDTADRG
jgi:signal transduction histidine kinase